jgi:hypothetical protein
MPGAGYPEIMTFQTSVVCLKKSISLNRIAFSQMESYLHSNNSRFVSLQSSVCLWAAFSFIFSCFDFIFNNSVSNISQLRAFVQNFLCSFYGKNPSVITSCHPLRKPCPEPAEGEGSQIGYGEILRRPDRVGTPQDDIAVGLSF